MASHRDDGRPDDTAGDVATSSTRREWYRKQLVAGVAAAVIVTGVLGLADYLAGRVSGFGVPIPSWPFVLCPVGGAVVGLVALLFVRAVMRPRRVDGDSARNRPATGGGRPWPGAAAVRDDGGSGGPVAAVTDRA